MPDRLKSELVMPKDKETAEALHAIVDRIEAIHRVQHERETQRTSLGARAWDVISKLSQAAIIGLCAWVLSLGARLTETETVLREIRATRFTSQMGLELEARMIARNDPQVALLISEMRTMSLNVTERLVRLEAQVEAIKAQTK